MVTTIALVGNPNCGKSTIFNALTGASQRIGNWPGVTVERKSGLYEFCRQRYDVIDLPGTYSLTSITEQQCLDEKIACEFLMSDDFDLVVNIIDSTNLERNLYLTSQLLEMGLPMVVVLNMMDVAERRKIKIDSKKLADQLGCPVIAMTAKKEKGVSQLKKLIAGSEKNCINKAIEYPASIMRAVNDIADSLNGNAKWRQWCALQLLEGDYIAYQHMGADSREVIKQKMTSIQEELHEDADILIADARYTWAHELADKAVCKQESAVKTISHFVDNVVLHRWFGIPIFLAVMYMLFFFAINVGGALQDFFDKSSEAIFVTGVANMLTHLHLPSWFVTIFSEGAGRGVNTTVTFIPVIGAMFLFLSFLESSGYMARAAFVVDRLMRIMGLPGKSFVPMIVGFGCNVPAIMAARTLDNRRDRVLTIMMSPFMSCGARLAIYAVFTSAFFSSNGHNVVFGLYLIGVLMAVVTGFILRKTLLRGEPSELVMEMPSYHLPRWSVIWSQTWHRLKSFIFKAGKLIVPVCMLIGSLNSIQVNYHHEQSSALSVMGKMFAPLVKPMGVQEDNWPATVGLMTGVLAKEVVVATLNTLYSQELQKSGQSVGRGAYAHSVQQGLREALQSVPNNLQQLMHSFAHPINGSAPDYETSDGVYGVMYQRFGGSVAAFSYLLFVLLYFPCVSATAAMVRELNKGWAFFSVFWTTSIAYGSAVLFYQVATLRQHVLSSSIWILLMIGLFIATIFSLKKNDIHENEVPV